MGIKQFFEEKINRWLYSEEIKEHIEEQESGRVPRPQQNGPTDAELEREMQRVNEETAKQIELIKAEDHSLPPSAGDIKRYHQYHINMITNINMVREKTGEEPPWPVPKNPLTLEEYTGMVMKDGWKGMRMSCGLPTGDLNRPKKPWTMADNDKQWSTKDEPEIHWKTKD